MLKILETIQKMSSGRIKNVINKMCLLITYKQDVALNNLKGLIYYKTQPNHVRTLNMINHLPELTVLTAKHDIAMCQNMLP